MSLLRFAFCWLAALALHVLAQGGSTGGGWYVVNESLVCTNVCRTLEHCDIVGAPDDNTIAQFCKQITDDCADGNLSSGQRSFTYGTPSNGILGTAQFGTGNNRGCPNYDQCNLSFKYLVSNMRYPSAPGRPNGFCRTATIDINGYYNHQKTGSILVNLPSIQRP